MKKLLFLTIPGCDVPVYSIEGNVEAYTFDAGMEIDADGTGNPHGDPDYQPHTSYKPDLNSEVDRYVVLPPILFEKTRGIVMGCVCVVRNNLIGVSTFCVVGDVGPSHKIGEASIATAKAARIPWNPVTGGEQRHVISYTFYPGLVANGYTLQPWKSVTL